MKFFFVALLSVGFGAAAVSAETAAWKIPLSQIAYAGIETPGLTKLANAPGKSVFFGEGDILWDLAKVLRMDARPSATPDWVVWNSTSKRIVSKGSLTSVWALHRLLGYENIPTQCRLRIDASKVLADGSPPDFSRKPHSSLSLVVRSGQKGSASISENGSTLQLHASPTYSEDKSVIDLAFEAASSLPGCPSLKVKTSVVLKNESSVWVARESDGGTGTDLFLIATVELADGTPFTEAALREVSGTTVPLGSPRREPEIIEMGDGRWLSWVGFGGEMLRSEVSSGEEDVDPFADTSPPESLVAAVGKRPW